MKTLTPEQCDLLLGEFPDSFVGRRDQLAFTLMLRLALRVSEAASIRVCDVRDDGTVIVKRLKRRKQVFTEFPLSGELAERVLSWCDELPDGSVYLFPTRSGKPVCRSQFYRSLVAAGDACGITVHPHVFRHTGVTQMLQVRDDAGLPVFDVHEVQHLAGHANLATTSLYAHVNSERLKRKARFL